MTSILELKNVSKHYQDFSLKTSTSRLKKDILWALSARTEPEKARPSS